MKIEQVYEVNSAIVPGWHILGWPQDFGLTPWADWVALSPTGEVLGQIRAGDPEADTAVFVQASSRLPITRKDGTGLEIDDRCVFRSHGGLTEYVWNGREWEEPGTAVPWQLRT